MRSVLTLLATPARRDLEPSVVETARRALAAAGAEVGEAGVLAEGLAADLPFEHLETGSAESAVREALGDAPIDLAAQPTAGRRKRLLVADMESTVIRNEMLDELAEITGLGGRISEITARAMRGELDFREALETRVALLEGLPEAVLEEARGRIEIDPGAAALVATLRGHGVKTALVTGGFGLYARPVGELLGFDLVEANELELAGGELTGRALEPILDRDAKLATLKRLVAELGTDPSAAAAVGDGANDLPMLQAAGLGVAYRAKPAVAEGARFRVEHADLSGLLYLQGYREGEIRRGL